MPVMTDQGSGTLRIATSTVILRAANTAATKLVQYEVAQQDVDIPEDTNRYVGCQYNSGSPNYVVKSSDVWNGNTEFRIGQIANEADTLHIFERRERRGDFNVWVTEYLHEVYGLQRAHAVGGLILSESADTNRYVEMSEGELYDALLEHDINAFDSSGTDRFDVYYRKVADSGWNKVANQQAWPNTQYDDNSGTLATLNANKFAVLWFYLETDGDIVMLYGQGEYPTHAAAVEESPPSGVPGRLELHGTLLGNLIFQKSAGAATAIHTAFPVRFGSASVVDHGSLGGLGHDDHSGYPWVDGRQSGQDLYGAVSALGGQLVLGSNSAINSNDAVKLLLGEDLTEGLGCFLVKFRVSGGDSAHHKKFMIKNTFAELDVPLTLGGADSSGALGPHLRCTTDADLYPELQILAFTHDNIAINFDSYFDTAWRSSDAGSNFQIRKLNDKVYFRGDSGITAGNNIAWNDILTIDLATSGVSIGNAAPTTSAILTLTSTTGALLLPRMTTTQRNALTGANGMVIYNTTTERTEYIENGSWVYHASTPV